MRHLPKKKKKEVRPTYKQLICTTNINLLKQNKTGRNSFIIRPEEHELLGSINATYRGTTLFSKRRAYKK